MNKKRFLVASHYSEAYAPTFPFLEFLEKKSLSLIYLLHPMIGSSVEYRVIKEKEKQSIFVSKRPLIVKLFSDLISTVSYALKNLENYEVYIGVNCLNVLPGLVMKFFLKKDLVVIFYSADFSRKRFPNILMNNFYLWLDWLAARFSDYVWVVTPRAMEARINQKINKEKLILVPNGVYLKKIHRSDKKNKKVLFYVGHLTETKGVQDILQALKNLRKYKLVIIGDGPFKEKLVAKTKELGLGEKVSFLGEMTNKKILRQISKYGIGLAPYLELEDYIHYGDSVKIKEYLASGCPVIMSNVTWVAEEVKRTECGVVVEDFVKDFKKAIGKIENNFDQMSKKAVKFSLPFDWQEIYEIALKKSRL